MSRVTGGVDGAVVPAGINTNETVYLVRHAEAHPTSWWEDGNYVGAGQWRALDLPYALQGKINPTLVYSIDPAQVTPGSQSSIGNAYSYVRTNYDGAAVRDRQQLALISWRRVSRCWRRIRRSWRRRPAISSSPEADFQIRQLLVGWEHDHIPTTVNALLVDLPWRPERSQLARTTTTTRSGR